jgi:hypothetical protein
MTQLVEQPFGAVTQGGPITRERVLEFERALAKHCGEAGTLIDPETLTSHWFAPGIYCRGLFIPAGACLTGAIHKHEHINILAQGDISVLTEHGVRRFTAPCVIVSSIGIKRVGYAHADTTWITVHANPDDERDLKKLEARFISPTFEALGADLHVLEDQS